MVFCSICGKKANPSKITCGYCGSLLRDDEYFNLSRLETFREIANDSNLKILEENPITPLEYDIILKNITEIAQNNLKNVNLKEKTILEKIKLITLSYAKITYKSKGAEQGSYSYNQIKIDDRLCDCDIISTLIHELAHHLFSEIFEQMLMYIWEVEKSDALEAFVSFTLGVNPVFVLINEYCAHTVEGRFIPHGYQRYGSFNNLLSEEFDLEKDEEAISFALIMGNSIADDLIHILENFITDDLRSEIKEIYQKSYNVSPKYDEILLESDDILDTEEKLKHMHIILMSGIAASNNEDSSELFSRIMDEFTLSNQEEYLR